MVRLLRHRQTKGAVTDRLNLRPPRHILTLPKAAVRLRSKSDAVCKIGCRLSHVRISDQTDRNAPFERSAVGFCCPQFLQEYIDEFDLSLVEFLSRRFSGEPAGAVDLRKNSGTYPTSAAIPSRRCCSQWTRDQSHPRLPIHEQPCRLVVATPLTQGTDH